MGQISIEGMQFYAYHGVYEEERIIGNIFVVDVFITTDLSSAAEADDLNETINYETIYQICQAEMRRTVQLIETLIEHIIRRIKFQFATIQTIRVRVQKNHPIPGHRISHSAVVMTGEFVQPCAKCEDPFVCYNDETCWCQQKTLSPETRANLEKRYEGCLCEDCLSFYSA